MIISRTPLRVSFFGGGTDYPEFYIKNTGNVVGTSIDKYVYVSINKNSKFFDYTTRIAYRKTELVKSIDEIEHPSVRACLDFMNISDPLDINIFSDLPAKTGLGSSSSFTVGLLNALYALNGKLVSKQQLAEEACYVEQKLIGEKVGSQDQFFAAYGGYKNFAFSKNEIIANNIVISDEILHTIQDHWLIFFTGRYRFAEDVLMEQSKRNKEGRNYKHLIEMDNYALKAIDLLQSKESENFIKNFSDILNKSWQLKKSLSSSISSSQLDGVIDSCLSLGALSAKLSGAGQDGFISLFVPPEKQSVIRSHMKGMGLMELNFKAESEGSKIIYL
jgi:D-glycero-alpha-D-manno-heptose-7-phosphate kinase